MVLKVGLTGGIGSGKTTVAKVFEILGVPVYYADAASKNLYTSDPQLMESVKKNFGEAVYTGNILNRNVLATLVFNDPQKLDLLNRLVHPPTIRHAEAWMAQQTAPYIIKEAALLFESGSVSGLDYVIGVNTPEHLRLKRVMDRDGLAREEVMQRMNRQIEETIKMRLCDFVIQNNEQEMVLPQIIQLHQHLLSIAKG